MTKPEKQDGTMELDVGQIDLLDLPLPPRSKPALEPEDARVSTHTRPPPLPPSAAPPAAPPNDDEPPVPSLALPNSSSSSQPHPAASHGAVSARQLAFGPPPKQKSPVLQLMLGMGGATLLCVAAWFGWKATHKAQPVAPAPIASTAPAPAPTQAFTMAPIEFTSPIDSSSASHLETPTPSAHASAPTTTSTSTAKPQATGRGTAPATSGKPPKTDELIKVEN